MQETHWDAARQVTFSWGTGDICSTRYELLTSSAYFSFQYQVMFLLLPDAVFLQSWVHRLLW